MDPFSPFSGRDPTHDIGTVLDHLLGVKCSLSTCDSLHEESSLFAN